MSVMVLFALGVVVVVVIAVVGFHRARNAKLASDVLPPRTMDYLVGLPDDTVPSIRMQAGHVIAWRDGRLEPADVVRTCAVLDRVIDGIPSFVWRDAGLSGGYDPAS